jgi:DNA repair protein RadD
MTRPSASVQVCSIQTLERRELPADIGIVIVDEAHRAFAFLYRWMAEWPKVPFIGLSATPWARGMGKYWDDLIVGNTTAGMIEAGYLSPFRVYAPGHPDLSEVKIVAGDYHEGQLGDAMDKAPLIADIVDSWRKHGEGRPTLLFAVNRAHAKHCQQEFLSAGIVADYIDAYTEAEERRIIGARLARGDCSVVCNVGCLTTGVDWDVRCIVLARPTRSEMLFVQMIGRGLRTAEGKDYCVILDHSDTHQTLGFVTDIYHEKLDDGRKEKQKKAAPEALPKECPECHYLRPPKVGKCPACGYAPKIRDGVDHVDGELTEVTPWKDKIDQQVKADWYAMLLGHAQANGKKDGWAYYKFKDKFKCDPPKSVERKEPTPEVLSWIKSQNIRWAAGADKRQKARAEALRQLDELFKK